MKSVCVSDSFLAYFKGLCAHTFRPEILDTLQVIHLLQRLRLFLRECLLVIIFSRSSYPIQEYPPSTGISEEIEDGKYKDDKGSTPECREHANKDALASGIIVAADVDNDIGTLVRWFSPCGIRPQGCRGKAQD